MTCHRRHQINILGPVSSSSAPVLDVKRGPPEWDLRKMSLRPGVSEEDIDSHIEVFLMFPSEDKAPLKRLVPVPVCGAF